MLSIILVLAIVTTVGSNAIPGVWGQTTKILSVNYPSSVNSGDPIHVTATVTYSGGYAVWGSLVDAKGVIIWADVSATPVPCGSVQSGACGVGTNGGSGTEVFLWSFAFFGAGINGLQVRALITDTKDAPHANPGSISTFDFSILVNQARTQVTNITPNYSTTTQTSTTATSTTPTTPIPAFVTTSTSAYSNPTPILPTTPQVVGMIVAIIAVVALAALIVYTLRGKISKTMKTKKKGGSKTKKLSSSNSFCVECGSKLPSKSKFCNNCGTKQP